MNIEEPTIRIDDPPPEPPKKLSDSEITAHTASLWNYVPVDESGFLPHAEYSTDFLQIGASAAICASVRGKKHKHDIASAGILFSHGGNLILLKDSDFDANQFIILLNMMILKKLYLLKMFI